MGFSACQTSNSNSVRPKYVFYFIGDGVGYHQITATQAYLSAINGEIGNTSLSFTHFPVTGVVETHAINRYITGSAAAGTALATGQKTSINTIGLNYDHSDSLFSIAYHANNAGYQVGIVTSVSIDHATPAAFYAHQPLRDMYHEISHDMLASGYRFFGGGGFKDPLGKKSKNPRGNIFEVGKDLGFYFTSDLMLSDSVQSKYSSIVYSSPNPAADASLKYQIDNASDDITLAQITSLAIDVLSNPKGFFLMVEGGKIDWACHENDAAAVIADMVAFSNAIAIALDFYKKYPNETLIIVTSDHETGGMSVGNRSNYYETNISLLENQTLSLEALSGKMDSYIKELKDPFKFEHALSFLEKELGIGTESAPLSDDHKTMIRNAYNQIINPKPQVVVINEDYTSYNPIAVAGIKVLNNMAGIGWTSGSHTGSHIPLYAKGQRQELFTGQMKNSDLPHRIAKVMGIEM
jgi:alkaline phosphatase